MKTHFFRSMTSGQRATPMPRRWRSAARTGTPLFPGLLLLTFLLVPVLALAQTGQPGDTNPLGVARPNALLWDHELFWLHIPVPGEQPYPGVSYNYLEYCTGWRGDRRA